MSEQVTYRQGTDFQIGDLYWFLGRPHRIVTLRPYEGNLLPLLGEGTRIAICDDRFSVTLPAKGLISQERRQQ